MLYAVTPLLETPHYGRHLASDNPIRQVKAMTKERKKRILAKRRPYAFAEDFEHEVKQWAEQLGFDAAAIAWKEMTHLILDDHEAINRATEIIARRVTYAVVDSLFFRSCIPTLLAERTRSHKATQARSKVEAPKGPPRASWRVGAEKLLKNKRFMNKKPTGDELIDRLVSDRYIEEGEGGVFYDLKTGKNAASSRENLLSEISKIKGKLNS
jgi:hypothetical protein